jgi:asparagine synthase (glutamine-hydrolysing)
VCGIAGFQGGFGAHLLAAMGEAVAHRGPDGEGRVLLHPGGDRPPVGLAHRRLSIIDLSAEGRQPMEVPCARCRSHGGDLVLVYNGEIYNFRELRAEMEARGHRFRSRTDSEVLLHLYAEAGLEMLPRLNGIFAFAIYDARESGRPPGVEPGDLFLARDPMGVKPLYHATVDGGVLFGSEIKALLRHPGLSRELDLVAVHESLAYLYAPAPRTVLQAVRKLPPGHAMLVRGGRVAREWTYYEMPYGSDPIEGTGPEVAAALRERVRTAVDRQLVSDVPVGAFLSGGLDSSAVVAMMKAARPAERPPCYAIGFPGGEGVDGSPADLPYARRVAEHLDVDLRPMEVGPEMIGELERMLYYLDEPQADPAPINALLIAEQARRDGVPVLLSGAGGDDLFSGYRRHRALLAERYWTWLPRSLRRSLAASARRVGEGGGGGGMGSAWMRRAVKLFTHADLDGDARTVSYFWWSPEAIRRPLYTAPVAEHLRTVDTAAPFMETLERIPGERDALNRMLFLEAKHFLADHNLNYTDKTGMAAGVEVRVPLLDLELVEFATRIPPRFKQRGSVGKAVFKEAMEPLLPREVVYRPKSGFGVPLRRWMRQELQDVVEDTLSEASLRGRGLFDPAAVRRLLAMDRAGRVDGTYTLFGLMCMELWCRMFVDAAAPVAPRSLAGWAS